MISIIDYLLLVHLYIPNNRSIQAQNIQAIW